MSRRLRLFLVDAFASKAFEGNPAAVVIVSSPISDKQRQLVAAEMNQSETAFVELDDSGGGGKEKEDKGASSGATARFATASRFVLRWFTPEMEVPLCGHATLAASHVLANELGNPSPLLVFRTVRGAGELSVARAPAGAGPGAGAAPPAATPLLEMSLPMAEPRDELPQGLRTVAQQRALIEALGLAWSGGAAAESERAAAPHPAADVAPPIPPVRMLAAGRVAFAAANGLDYALVEASPAVVGAASPPNLVPRSPDAAAARLLRELPAPETSALRVLFPRGLAGVIVAVRGGEEEEEDDAEEEEGQGGATTAGGQRPRRRRHYRCTSRFFAPWMGIAEDAVTGSAHSVLGPYFDGGSEREGAEVIGGAGGGWWWARQASPRSGDVRVRVDREARRVFVAGEAKTVVRGEIELPPAD